MPLIFWLPWLSLLPLFTGCYGQHERFENVFVLQIFFVLCNNSSSILFVFVSAVKYLPTTSKLSQGNAKLINDSVHRPRLRSLECRRGTILTHRSLWLSDIACGQQWDGLPRVYLTVRYIFSNFLVLRLFFLPTRKHIAGGLLVSENRIIQLKFGGG